MKLVGIEKIDYKKKDGTQVKGCKFHYTDNVDNENVEGVITGNFYVSSAKADELPALEELELGIEFDILYNRFGGIKDIKII